MVNAVSKIYAGVSVDMGKDKNKSRARKIREGHSDLRAKLKVPLNCALLGCLLSIDKKNKKHISQSKKQTKTV